MLGIYHKCKTDNDQWEKSPVAGFGWSEDETLIVVCQDGTVRRYAELSDDFAPFSLGHVCHLYSIMKARTEEVLGF